MHDHLMGLDIIGGDDATNAVALANAPRPVHVNDGGSSWTMIAGIALTVIVGVFALPKLLKD